MQPGDFDAIAYDLSQVQTIVSANKLETDGQYLLHLDEELILRKWQALAAECQYLDRVFDSVLFPTTPLPDRAYHILPQLHPVLLIVSASD